MHSFPILLCVCVFFRHPFLFVFLRISFSTTYYVLERTPKVIILQRTNSLSRCAKLETIFEFFPPIHFISFECTAFPSLCHGTKQQGPTDSTPLQTMLGTVLGQGLSGDRHLEVGGLPGRDGRRRFGTGAAATLGLVVVVVAGGRHGLGRGGSGTDAAGAAHLGQGRGRSGRGGGLLHHLDLLPALLVGRSGLEGLGQLVLHLLGPAQVGVGGDRGLGR